ncbi:MAG: DUF3363 domain-containing protein [Pseudomonadota bacterium]
MGDDEFTPRLGRIRSLGGRSAKRYLGKLYGAMEKARPGAFAKRSGARFSGNRIGRGAGIGAALSYRKHPFAKFRSRRVAVKIRSVRLGANGLAKARAHLRYIQRDGADRDGKSGILYGPEQDVVDGNAFLEEGKDDRHQFRMIVSPEEAGELGDLNGFTRDLMAAAERDLGTTLDWVAVNHHDTDHPHVHIVLRGKADDGKDLVIARNHITHGYRMRAEELATLELGLRRDIDIAQARMAEAQKDRFTSLDRDLLERSENGAVVLGRPQTAYDRFQKRLLLARLRHLEKMNLAAREDGAWRLAPQLEATLKDLGRRGDIIRSMDAAIGRKFSFSNVRELGRDTSPAKLIGRIAGSGAADDAHDKRFLALDGTDGNQWHVRVDIEPGAMPTKGAIVEVTMGNGAPRKSDRTIAAIAERNGGIYSDALHTESDPAASDEFRAAHKLRLEALRRAGIIERFDDGTWRIPDDYLERVSAREALCLSARVRTLSWVGLEQLTEARAATFLDDVLENKMDLKAEDQRFGADLKSALAARRRWLMSEGLAKEQGDNFQIDRAALRHVERGALGDAAANIASELGKEFVPPVEGECIQGQYLRPVNLPSGRFALIEKSKEFTLVPWREALERRRGLEISGTMTRGRVSWKFGKNRAGPVR